MRWQLLALIMLAGCGPQGPAGATGPAGPPGSSWTPVQFCTNYTGTYSGPLPEFGFCVDGVIYATCWDGKNAWTCEVYPGNWDSTSTGAPCNFTVGPNCSVTDY